MSLLIEKMDEQDIGEVYIDRPKRTIYIYSLLIFYGNEANEDLQNIICKDIENAWNGANGEVEIDNETYKVKFKIEGIVNKNITAKEIEENPYTWKKFYRIENDAPTNISYVDAIRSNTGYFMKKNIMKENSMTGPHEIGHNWGLVHPPEMDIRGKGQPHIMYPRGTIVDSEYRYKPEANATYKDGKWILEDGCTLNTDKRKVTQQNISDLKLDELIFNDSDCSNLSKLTNKYHQPFIKH